MADDAGVKQQSLDITFAKLGQFVEIKLRKDLAESITLVQDRPPRQSGLEPFKA